MMPSCSSKQVGICLKHTGTLSMALNVAGRDNGTFQVFNMSIR